MTRTDNRAETRMLTIKVYHQLIDKITSDGYSVTSYVNTALEDFIKDVQNDRVSEYVVRGLKTRGIRPWHLKTRDLWFQRQTTIRLRRDLYDYMEMMQYNKNAMINEAIYEWQCKVKGGERDSSIVKPYNEGKAHRRY